MFPTDFCLTVHSQRYSWMCTMSKESCYSCCSRAVLTGSAAMCSRKHRIFFLKKGGDSLPVIKLMLIWLAWEALGGMHTKLPCGKWRCWVLPWPRHRQCPNALSIILYGAIKAHFLTRCTSPWFNWFSWYCSSCFDIIPNPRSHNYWGCVQSRELRHTLCVQLREFRHTLCAIKIICAHCVCN